MKLPHLLAAAALAVAAIQTPAFAVTSGSHTITDTRPVVNCFPETYWCTDPVTGKQRLCVRRVCR